jgi:glycosyltransferase involved in cell wall biosynthesis
MNKIRVCHLASGDLWAGAEIQIAMLASQLVDRADVDLSVVLFNAGRLAEELEATGVRTIILDENRLSSRRVVRRLVDTFKQGSPDVVHTHGYKQHVLGTIAAKLAGVRAVVKTVHGSMEPFGGAARLKMRFYGVLERILDDRATDTILSVSNDIRDQLVTRTSTRVVTIHNGIDEKRVVIENNREAVRKHLGIAPDHYVVGSVGRLVPVKGYDFLQRAAKLVLDEIPNVSFILVGDGPQRAELEDLSRDLGVDHNLIFTGHRSDAYDLINSMDVFVISSLHEGIPTVLLEAMLLSIPVVSTAVGGIPEVLVDGTGSLVEYGDEAGLALAVVRALTSRQATAESVRRAERRVQDKFSTCRQVEQVYSVYRDVVGAD